MVGFINVIDMADSVFRFLVLELLFLCYYWNFLENFPPQFILTEQLICSMVHLATLSVAEIIQRRLIRGEINNESDKVWKKSGVT
jgi:hypothetical protein